MVFENSSKLSNYTLYFSNISFRSHSTLVPLHLLQAMFCMKIHQDKIITLFLQLNMLYLEDLVGFLNLFNALSNLQKKCQEFTISSSWVAKKYNFQPLAFCSTPRWFDNSLTVARLSSANKQMNFTNSIFSTHYFLKENC